MADTDPKQPTYHNTSSPYSLPNNNQEHARLDHQSDAINQMMGMQRIQAPLSDPKRILEVGCGTGNMTTWFGNHFNAAEVYGLDLSRVPESLHAKPSNVRYIQGNILDAEPDLPVNSFDYIFHRMLVFGINDWRAYINKCFGLLRPGGWLEMQDLNIDFFDRYGNNVAQNWKWYEVLLASASEIGIDIRCPDRFEQNMKTAGFVDIQRKEYFWTLSSEHWEEHPDSDEIGIYTLKEVLPEFRRATSKILQNSELSEEKKEGLLDDQTRDMNMEKGGHAKFYVYWGRKP